MAQNTMTANADEQTNRSLRPFRMANYNASSNQNTAMLKHKQTFETRPERWLLANGVEPHQYALRSDTNSSTCHTH
jgi:hypothetical protein